MPSLKTPFATRIALSTAGLLVILGGFVAIDHLSETQFFDVAWTLGGLLVAAFAVRWVNRH